MANNFKNSFASSVSNNSASPTDIYTANNGSPINSIAVAINVSNVDSSAVEASVLVYDSSTTTPYHIIKNAPIPAGGALQVVDGKLVLNGDDKLQIYASNPNVEVVASILEDVT